jgi:hypothetical protein
MNDEKNNNPTPCLSAFYPISILPRKTRKKHKNGRRTI